MTAAGPSLRPDRPTRVFARLGYIALVLAAFFNLGALWVTETSYDRVRLLADAVLDAQRRSAGIERIALHLVGAESALRGYVITGDEAYLEPMRQAKQELDGEIQSLAERVRGNSVQASLIDALTRLSKQEMAELDATVALRRDQGFAPAQAAMSTHFGKLTMDTLRLTLDGMMREEDRVRQSRLDDLRTNQVAIRLGVFAIAPLRSSLSAARRWKCKSRSAPPSFASCRTSSSACASRRRAMSHASCTTSSAAR
jgi:CHASE3 domain sensor protein